MDSEIDSEQDDTKKQKVHKCTFEGCDAVFYRPYRLKNHMAKHEGKRPYTCDIENCGKTYTNSSHLKRHKIVHHDQPSTQNQQVPCTEKGCGLILSNKYSLKKHLSRFHDESKFPHVCSECPEKFKKRKHLTQHLALHKGEVVHRCEPCDLGFISLTAFNKHTKNHKTYHCDCGQSFGKWSLLCEHRKSCRTKKVHECVICNKTFTLSWNLKAHALTHVEESQKEVYRCHYLNCTRSYAHKKNLTQHISYFHEQIHANNNIECSECKEKFKTERYLKRHVQNIHNRKKILKPRKPRKDRGTKKKSAAALLSGVDLTNEQHLTLINHANTSVDLDGSDLGIELTIEHIDTSSSNNDQAGSCNLNNTTLLECLN